MSCGRTRHVQQQAPSATISENGSEPVTAWVFGETAQEHDAASTTLASTMSCGRTRHVQQQAPSATISENGSEPVTALVHDAVATTIPCHLWVESPRPAHASDTIEALSKQQCKDVFTRFQALLLAPHQTSADLRERFIEEDVHGCHSLDGDSALRVLTATFAKHSRDMPFQLLAGMNWKGLLKRYGVYGIE